ncbi:MAG: hypothetical protein JSW48_07875 [Betaproteobacteria bacterium]|jgi:hypothetical protein|nr:MAG: hypothetical protein JSW48_07875 [Betaproteobacteria bacterium]
MNKLLLVLSAILLCFSGSAASECRDADGNVVDETQCAGEPPPGANQLPEDALAQVKELKAKMRYFTAIGFHKQSKEQRDAIVAIYAEYGVALPDEYKD